MSAVTRSSAAPVSRATQAPNENPAAQSLAVGIPESHVVQRRTEVVHLPFALVEHSVTRADAAKVEPQYGATDPCQPLRPLIDSLRVHRPAKLRVGMGEDDGSPGALRAVPVRQAARGSPRAVRPIRSNQ